jgi:imidazolonepropionase-like amidohydrolase
MSTQRNRVAVGSCSAVGNRFVVGATLVAIVLFAAASSALANPNVPAPPQSEPILITNAVIHTVSGATIENGRMLFDGGRIEAIAGPGESIATPARVIDLAGKHVYPGMIGARTALGLTEIDAVRATNDLTEPGLINPNARADIAVNPDSELIPVTRANGVLAVLTVPQAGNDSLIIGQSAVLALDGWTVEDMTIKAPVGLHVVWPQMRVPDDLPAERKEELEKMRDERLRTIEESFEAARAYRLLPAAERAFEIDLRWEAMLPALEGNLPIFAHVQDLMQIRHALHVADEYGLRVILVGAADAWRVADLLAEKRIPVIVSSVQRLPLRRWESYSTRFQNAARLSAAGVSFAIATPGDSNSAPNERNLPYEAAKAVAHGLPNEEALRAVTLYPARILGVADRLGSLEAGKDATFIVTDGDPLEITTRVERAFIRGRELDLTTRHTVLYEKYREKLRQRGR